MKIALITPKNDIYNEKTFYDYRFYSQFLFTKKYFSYLLAIPTLVSLTPPEHEIKIFDENIEDIDFDFPVDLVGISVRTIFAKRAYEIADKYRSLGIKVVLGGIHPSMCAEEALGHSDSVVVGEAEAVWAGLLSDAQTGNLKRVYKSGVKSDLKQNPAPGRRALARDRYFSDIVQTTKGCPFHCEFCSVYAYDGTTIRNKTVEQVVVEIKELCKDAAGFKKKSIFFADDNIIANRKFAKELFIALKPFNLNWSCQASINVSKDPDMLRLMREAGCGAILIGFESISDKNLAQMEKGVNQRHDYIEAIKTIQAQGILVHSSFIVGYDFDTKESFDELAGFIAQTNLLMPVINILTPFPGTKLFSRMEKEGRILHKDWSKYNTKNVVFRPKLMTPEELYENYTRLIKKVYSFDEIRRKLEHYWEEDFWRRSNEIDPIKFKYRLLFAVRLVSFMFSANAARAAFIMRLLPRLFRSRVRVSTILTLMAYNDYAYST
ncbi:MAG: B12-binding domain-containing radical SAM protein [Deltaproteobacteria bacterium]|nr:B12-binding domain-containing radical SAM protein [Deltaproteobacteria bacterium]